MTMWMWSRAALLGSALALATPSFAQLDESLQRKSYGVAFRVVSCAEQESPSALRKLMETELASKEEEKQVSRMQSLARRCAGEFPKLMPLLVRNVSAILLYDEEFKRKAPQEPANPLPLPGSFAVVPADRKGTDAQQNIWYVAGVANCAAWVNPGLAREMVLADPDPKSEEEAFAALKPALDQCLPAGAAFPIRPIEFRGILAEQLLKRSRLVESTN
jgi:hypothetical protein